MIVYTFNVNSLTKRTVNGIEDTVVSVVWERSGTDEDGHVGKYKICTNLDISQVGISTNYTTYSDLTKSDILSWMEETVDMDMVNGEIDKGIEKSRLNEVQIGSGSLPWDPVPVISESKPPTPEQIAEAENDQTDKRVGVGTT